jgi:hypothetical protein
MTSQMQESNYNELMIKDIINKLQIIDVDGETMQYILKEVGMEDQMLKQLIGTASGFSLHHYLNLRHIAKNS